MSYNFQHRCIIGRVLTHQIWFCSFWQKAVSLGQIHLVNQMDEIIGGVTAGISLNSAYIRSLACDTGRVQRACPDYGP